METRLAYKWAAILLATAIAAGSRLRVSHVGRTVPVQPAMHYALHVFPFALLTYLFLNSTSSRRIAWLLFLAVLLFGYGTEFYEHLKDTYPVETPDVLADALGACLALVAWLALRQSRPGWLKYRSE